MVTLCDCSQHDVFDDFWRLYSKHTSIPLQQLYSSKTTQRLNQRKIRNRVSSLRWTHDKNDKRYDWEADLRSCWNNYGGKRWRRNRNWPLWKQSLFVVSQCKGHLHARSTKLGTYWSLLLGEHEDSNWKSKSTRTFHTNYKLSRTAPNNSKPNRNQDYLQPLLVSKRQIGNLLGFL